MAIEVGTAYISILPSTSKLAPAIRKELDLAEKTTEGSGKKSGKGYEKGFKSGIKGMATGALAAGAGIGALVASSVTLEKQFSQTMSVIGATTNAPAKELGKLNKLALDLGASTSFSASEAADAMLELAKAGLNPATIAGGALEGTLQLAAAGGTSLASAATIASNALNTFNLEGKDMASISAALAGGANASTASVESLGQALSQVGPGAKNAGLDLNETVAVLAAFDNAGIKGSDAGTSLKTMLTRLVPQTAKAATAMSDLNLDFTNADGSFVSITEVSQQLQDSLKGLSEEQRTTALATIFGSDATRAASVLMDEGAKGLGKYIKATQDQGAAEKASKARMSGTAGALERLSGSWETFRLQLGLKVAPAVTWVSDRLGSLFDFLGKHSGVVLVIAGVFAALVGVILAINAALIIGTAAVTAWGVAVAVATSPITLTILAIGALIGVFVLLYKKNETARRIMDSAWAGIKAAIKGTVDWMVNTAWPFIQKVWDGIVVGAKVVWTILKVIFVAIATYFSLLFQGMRYVWNKAGKPLFAAISKAATAVWNWLGKYIFPHITVAFKALMLGLKVLKERVWDPMWAGIKMHANGAWTFLKTKVFAPLKSAVKAMGDAFAPVARVIGRAWGKIKKAAAGPVNFVIETVYTNGIKKTWDRIADSVGLDLKLPSVSPITGFANGTEDHRAQIARGGSMRLWAEPETGGEAYIPLANSKRGRSTAILGQVANKFGYGLTQYADGGFFGDAWEKIKDVGSSFLSGPSALIKKVISGPMNSLLGGMGGGTIGKIGAQFPRKIVGGLVDKAKDFASSVFGGDQSMKGGGKFSGGPVMGWQNMWNVLKNAFPGASLNSAYRPGAITAVGTPSYHGQGRAIDVTPSMDIFNWLAKTFPNSTELIYSPAGGRQLYKGRQMQFGEPTRGDHWDHVHWAMANGGILPKVYDQGGVLGHGALGINTSGKPEAILTNAESRALKAGGSIANGRKYRESNATPIKAERKRVTVQIGARDFEGYMSEVASDVVDSQSDFEGTRRRRG